MEFDVIDAETLDELLVLIEKKTAEGWDLQGNVTMAHSNLKETKDVDYISFYQVISRGAKPNDERTPAKLQEFVDRVFPPPQD